MKREYKCGIYRIYCQVNRECYVGSSYQISVRWGQHRTKLRTGNHTSPYLQHAWNKYGEASFTFKVLEECDKAILTEREQYWIDRLNPKFNSLTAYPRREWSEEMKDKLRGRDHSEETKAKMKAYWAEMQPEVRERALAGLAAGRSSKTPETRAKISAAQKGQVRKTHCVNGHERTSDNILVNGGCKRCTTIRERVARGYSEGSTDEQVTASRYAKISEALTGRSLSDERKEATRAGVLAHYAAHPTTHCIHGHPYDENNNYLTKAGYRMCKVCNNLRSKENYKAKGGNH